MPSGLFITGFMWLHYVSAGWWTARRIAFQRILVWQKPSRLISNSASLIYQTYKNDTCPSVRPAVCVSCRIRVLETKCKDARCGLTFNFRPCWRKFMACLFGTVFRKGYTIVAFFDAFFHLPHYFRHVELGKVHSDCVQFNHIHTIEGNASVELIERTPKDRGLRQTRTLDKIPT